MPKTPTIRPIYSKKKAKNIYKYWDEKSQRYTKCAGFVVDIWDGATETRIRRHVRADYQTAKGHYKEMMEILRDGNESLPTLIKQNEVRTIGDLVERYVVAKKEPSLRNRQVRSIGTIERTAAAVRAFKRAFGGDVRIKSITAGTVERYIHKCRETGRKPGGINVDLRHLKALFNWALRREYISRNPFLSVEMFPTDRSEPRPLAPVELERLFVECPPGSKWHPLVMVYLLTGARLSEILKPKLSWKDIDFENEKLILSMRKGRKSTEFPLNTILVEIFRELKARPYRKNNSNEPEDADYPFPFNASYISHKIKAIMNSAGIDATAHDLRDSFVSHLIYLGYPIEDVSKMAGHSSIKITEQHYYGQIQERRREMLSDLGDHLTAYSNLPKTGTKNRDKTRSTLTNPDQSKEPAEDEKNPLLPSEKEGLPCVARDRIELPTHGFSVHCSPVGE